jgi:hypothetical protein
MYFDCTEYSGEEKHQIHAACQVEMARYSIQYHMCLKDCMITRYSIPSSTDTHPFALDCSS